MASSSTTYRAYRRFGLSERIVIAGGVLLAAAVVLCSTGCASYTDRIKESQRAVSEGDAERAIATYNRELGLDDEAELDAPPPDLDDEKALLLLERATMLQAIGRYESASRDMITVDDRLEWLDIQSDTGDAILNFVYSDDAGSYRAPAHERLLLNTMNMINFLAQGNDSGARVEARRFDILQRFFLDDSSAEFIPDVLGLGNYLAGAAFEAGRDYTSAARFYTMAYMHGTWPEPSADRLLDLLSMTGYGGAGLGEMRQDAEELFDLAADHRRIDRSTYRETHQQGDTLVVVQTGVAPYREAERVSLEQGLRYSQRSPYASVHIDGTTHDQALQLAAAGVLTWVNFSTLSRNGIPSSRSTTLHVDDRQLRLSNPIDIGAQIEAAWDMISATAMAAAISRAVVRAAAGLGARFIAEGIAETAGAGGGSELIGWLTGIILQSSLAAADTPDTRSWTSLPDGINLVRLQLPPGQHDVHLDFGDRSDTRQLEIGSSGFQLLNFSRIR